MANKWTFDNVCAYCVASLIYTPSTQARISMSEQLNGQEWQKLMNDLRSYDSHKIGLAMVAVWNLNATLEINAYVAKPAMITIHGTRLCDVHLGQEWQRFNSPQTVRMAQWRDK